MDSIIGRGTSPYFYYYELSESHAKILCHNIIALRNVQEPFFAKIYLLKFLTPHFAAICEIFRSRKFSDIRY